MTSVLFRSLLLPAAMPARPLPAAGQLTGRAQTFPVDLLLGLAQSGDRRVELRRAYGRHSTPQARLNSLLLARPLAAGTSGGPGNFAGGAA